MSKFKITEEGEDYKFSVSFNDSTNKFYFEHSFCFPQETYNEFVKFLYLPKKNKIHGNVTNGEETITIKEGLVKFYSMSYDNNFSQSFFLSLDSEYIKSKVEKFERRLSEYSD